MINRFAAFKSQEISSARAQEIFSNIDLDNDGTLSQAEFVTGCLKEEYCSLFFVRFQSGRYM